MVTFTFRYFYFSKNLSTSSSGADKLQAVVTSVNKHLACLR